MLDNKLITKLLNYYISFLFPSEKMYGLDIKITIFSLNDNLSTTKFVSFFNY